jgi:DNA repair protein RadC
MIEQASQYQIKAVANSGFIPGGKITSSKDSENFARKFYHEDMILYESAFIIMLNNASNVIGWAKISQGGITGTVIDILIVAKYAIDLLAKNIILIHNHPSGNKNPSKADGILTKKIKEGLSLLDINLLDHIILTEDNYYSFADNSEL